MVQEVDLAKSLVHLPLVRRLGASFRAPAPGLALAAIASIAGAVTLASGRRPSVGQEIDSSYHDYLPALSAARYNLWSSAVDRYPDTYGGGLADVTPVYFPRGRCDVMYFLQNAWERVTVSHFHTSRGVAVLDFTVKMKTAAKVSASAGTIEREHGPLRAVGAIPRIAAIDLASRQPLAVYAVCRPTGTIAIGFLGSDGKGAPELLDDDWVFSRTRLPMCLAEARSLGLVKYLVPPVETCAGYSARSG